MLKIFNKNVKILLMLKSASLFKKKLKSLFKQKKDYQKEI